MMDTIYVNIVNNEDYLIEIFLWEECHLSFIVYLYVYLFHFVFLVAGLLICRNSF